MQLKGHSQKVRAIEWFPSDMGFATAGQDGNCYFYDLLAAKETNLRNTEKDFAVRGVQFTGMCIVPGKDYEVLAVGNDGKLWQSED